VISRYRESARVWSDPIGRALMHLHLRPNHLTLIGLGVSLAAAAAFVTGHIRTGGALLLLAGLCDFFDGALARATPTSSSSSPSSSSSRGCPTHGEPWWPWPVWWAR
jgi:hypothetical protein